jgi:hypothetical protein
MRRSPPHTGFTVDRPNGGRNWGRGPPDRTLAPSGRLRAGPQGRRRAALPRVPALSRKAALECSPRRKPWETWDIEQAPPGRKISSHSHSSNASFVPFKLPRFPQLPCDICPCVPQLKRPIMVPAGRRRLAVSSQHLSPYSAIFCV